MGLLAHAENVTTLNEEKKGLAAAGPARPKAGARSLAYMGTGRAALKGPPAGAPHCCAFGSCPRNADAGKTPILP
jgi:hypothetical protein